jgi:phage shock protein A
MSDAAADLEQRIATLLKGVQRMADGFGALEQRLPELARRTELEQIADIVAALSRAVDLLLREQQAILETVRQPAGLDRLTDAVRALRDDLAESYERQQRAASPAAPPEVDLSPLVGELQALRADVGRLRARPGSPEAPAPVDLSGITGRLDSLASAVEQLRARPEAVAVAPDLSGIYDRLGGIEWRLGERLDPLVERVAGIESRLEQPVPAGDRAVADRLAAIEATLNDLAHREDVRRGVERVVGEVRAVDERVGAMAEDVRLVRVLRDGLSALESGVDGVRQLAARGATSQQMADVSRELGAVLGEIAAARSQVLRVEQSASPVAADVIAVGRDVDELGARIDKLADAVEARGAEPQVTERLRAMSDSARVLGNSVLADLRARRRRADR